MMDFKHYTIADEDMPDKCPDTCIYKRFSKNMRNAEQHDTAIRNEVLEGLQKIFARNYDDGIYKDQYAAFHAAKDEYLRNTGTSDKGGE